MYERVFVKGGEITGRNEKVQEGGEKGRKGWGRLGHYAWFGPHFFF